MKNFFLTLVFGLSISTAQAAGVGDADPIYDWVFRIATHKADKSTGQWKSTKVQYLSCKIITYNNSCVDSKIFFPNIGVYWLKPLLTNDITQACAFGHKGLAALFYNGWVQYLPSYGAVPYAKYDKAFEWLPTLELYGVKDGSITEHFYPGQSFSSSCD